VPAFVTQIGQNVRQYDLRAPVTAAQVASIQTIPGVSSIGVQFYSITVWKGAGFDWAADGIEAAILAIVPPVAVGQGVV
jgi:hypothetical protein